MTRVLDEARFAQPGITPYPVSQIGDHPGRILRPCGLIDVMWCTRALKIALFLTLHSVDNSTEAKQVSGMVERRLLTEEFVNAVKPPSKGERWIADTKVRGFGLRLWAGRKEGQAAFAIRVADELKKTVRKTFHPQPSSFMSWRWKFRLKLDEIDISDGIPMGFFLDDAREWASLEIKRLKGRRLTEKQKSDVDNEYKTCRRSFESRLQSINLRESADSVINGGYGRGLSIAYTDRLLKIFYVYVPEELASKEISQISFEEVRKIWDNPEIPPSSKRTLKAFLHQVFARVRDVGGPNRYFKEEHRSRKSLTMEHEKAASFIEDLEIDEFKQLFAALEADEQRWQASLCLRLAFELRAPLIRLTAARWDQIIENRWYPYRPAERVDWWRKWGEIDQDAAGILERLSLLGSEQFPHSEYWFPSPVTSGSHIRSIDRVWRTVLASIGWPLSSLQSFVRVYLEKTLWDRVGYVFGDVPDQRAEITAKLSKVVKNRTVSR